MKKNLCAISALFLAISPSVLAEGSQSKEEIANYITKNSELAGKESLQELISQRAAYINSREIKPESKVLALALLQRGLKEASVDVFLKADGQGVPAILLLKKMVSERASANPASLASVDILSEIGSNGFKEESFYKENIVMRSIIEQAVGAKALGALNFTNEEIRREKEAILNEVNTLNSCLIASEADARKYLEALNQDEQPEADPQEDKLKLSSQDLEKAQLESSLMLKVKVGDSEINRAYVLENISLDMNSIKDRILADDLATLETDQERLRLEPGVHDFLELYGLRDLKGDSQKEISLSREDAQKVISLIKLVHMKLEEGSQDNTANQSAQELYEDFVSKFTCGQS